MRRGEGTPPYGAEQMQAAILQNQTQEIQSILAGLDFELTAILPIKRNTESLPHSCRGRDSFAQTPTGNRLQALPAVSP